MMFGHINLLRARICVVQMLDVFSRLDSLVDYIVRMNRNKMLVERLSVSCDLREECQLSDAKNW